MKLTSGEEVGTGAVVVAMGPWSAQGTSWLGGEMPLESVRASTVKVEMPQRYPPYGPTRGMDSADGVLWPKADGWVLVGYVEDRGVGLDDDWVKLGTINKMVADGVSLVPRLSEARLGRGPGGDSRLHP